MPELLRERVGRSRREARVAGAAIASVGMAVPEHAVPNRVIAERLGVDETWIETRTGIRSRRIDQWVGVAVLGLASAARSDRYPGFELASTDVQWQSGDHHLQCGEYRQITRY